jgi:hypothetical protein
MIRMVQVFTVLNASRYLEGVWTYLLFCLSIVSLLVQNTIKTAFLEYPLNDKIFTGVFNPPLLLQLKSKGSLFLSTRLPVFSKCL